ncbi:MAG: 50S ribosomal protein L24 [Eubacteriales bacterium]
MKHLDIKRDDTVVVLSGKDKGKRGTVLEVMPEAGKLIIEGVNVVSRHQKPRRQGEAGGIIRKPAPIYACKVSLICPKTDKPTRVGYRFENGKKIRYAKKSGVEV